MDWKQQTWLEQLVKFWARYEIASEYRIIKPNTANIFFSLTYVWSGNWSTLPITAMETGCWLQGGNDQDELCKSDPAFPREHMEHSISGSPLLCRVSRKSFREVFMECLQVQRSHNRAVMHWLLGPLIVWHSPWNPVGLSFSSLTYLCRIAFPLMIFPRKYRIARWGKAFKLTRDSWFPFLETTWVTFVNLEGCAVQQETPFLPRLLFFLASTTGSSDERL